MTKLRVLVADDHAVLRLIAQGRPARLVSGHVGPIPKSLTVSTSNNRPISPQGLP